MNGREESKKLDTNECDKIVLFSPEIPMPFVLAPTDSEKKMHSPYFFGYKTEFFSFQHNPKDLDPSCKTDLDLRDCLGRVKLVL